MLRARHIYLAAAVLLSAASATGCAGSSVTLHGTFTDYLALTGPSLPTCSYEISPLNGSAPYRITIAEDNVSLGSVSINWQDNGNAAPKIIHSSDSEFPLAECTGTWSMVVKTPAQYAYEIGITGISGAMDVQSGNAGGVIAIDDGFDGNEDSISGTVS